jgi:K+-transporting ATPase ATPase C chain
MNNDLITSLRPALVMTLLFALLLGVAYPLAMTIAGQMLFPRQAGGSLVWANGRVIGSTVVGQAFTSDRYFQTRPSAAGKGDDGMNSGGSNYGPTSLALHDRLKAQIDTMRKAAPGRAIPGDLVTASASGLDPDISPEAALYQVDRIAKARHIAPATLRDLVSRNTEHPLLGFLGEPHINVFDLNRRLDALQAKR